MVKVFKEIIVKQLNGIQNHQKEKILKQFVDCYQRKAFELILKSAEEGYKFALYMVGYCYQYGVGILKDENQAFEWYLKAAKKGDVCCQYLVANYYYVERYISKIKKGNFFGT